MHKNNTSKNIYISHKVTYQKEKYDSQLSTLNIQK